MRLKLILAGFLASVMLSFGLAGVGFAKLSIPTAPPLDRPIVDQTKTLSDEDITRISAKINEQRAKKSFQIAVLIIPMLGNDDSLEEYSISVARKWGVGEKKVSNGVLILIAKDDRKMRIEVGDGMEGVVTDAQAARIIRNVMAPKFRQNDFAGGIEAAVTSVIDLSEGRETSLRDDSETSAEDIIAFVVFGLFFIVPFVGSILARSKNWWAGGIIGGVVGVALMIFWSFAIGSIIAAVILSVLGFVFDFLVSRNYREAKRCGREPSWWAGGGFGGGSSSGSSGGSFGGGGFSGGGASGGW